MKKLVCMLICLAMLLSVVGSTATAWADSEVYVHFLVVPSKTKGARSITKALASLKTKLAELAGGYTHLGPTDGGYLNAKGNLERENNFSFIVASPKNISSEIEKYVAENFATEKPYILVWKAVSNY